MRIRKKKKKLTTLKNNVIDILETYAYYIFDYADDEKEIEQCLRAIIDELNKLKEVKSIIYFTPRQIKSLQAIIKNINYSYEIYNKMLNIAKIFGLNFTKN